MVLVLAGFCPIRNMSCFLWHGWEFGCPVTTWFVISNTALKRKVWKNSNFYLNQLILHGWPQSTLYIKSIYCTKLTQLTLDSWTNSLHGSLHGLTQNGCGHVYVPYTTWLPVSLGRRVLSWDSLPIITCPPPPPEISNEKMLAQGKYFVWAIINQCAICNTLSHLQQYVHVFCILKNSSITLVKNWLFPSHAISFSL